MADEKKSSWEIFAIVVTAIAAVFAGLSGVAALITAMNGSKEGAVKTETAPATQPSSADDAAQRAAAEANAAKARAAVLERQLAEIEAARAQAAAAKASAAELEKKLAAALAVPKQGDIITDDFTGMRLAYVPGNCFMMGSSTDDKDHQDDEGPVHEVCVDSFWMGQYEVTQGQWQKIMGSNPAKFQKGGNYPVEQVSWNDAQDFIKELNNRTGRHYRLPTEAEWEYACRANSSGRYCGGDDLDAVAWYSENSGGSIHAVGTKRKNDFELYDMSGNVQEWCSDWYNSGYYVFSSEKNPFGPSSGSNRVIRGGGWSSCVWLNLSGTIRSVSKLILGRTCGIPRNGTDRRLGNTYRGEL